MCYIIDVQYILSFYPQNSSNFFISSQLSIKKKVYEMIAKEIFHMRSHGMWWWLVIVLENVFVLMLNMTECLWRLFVPQKFLSPKNLSHTIYIFIMSERRNQIKRTILILANEYFCLIFCSHVTIQILIACRFFLKNFIQISQNYFLNEVFWHWLWWSFST